MKSRQIHVYAIHEEFIELLAAVNARLKLSYVETGMFDDDSVKAFDDARAIRPHATYLAMPRGHRVTIRHVRQTSGRTRFAIDQLENPDTISLECGDECGDSCLLPSHIGTVSASKPSTALYRAHVSEVQDRFELIKSYYVSPGAASLLDRGGRLRPTPRSSQEYDLSR